MLTREGGPGRTGTAGRPAAAMEPDGAGQGGRPSCQRQARTTASLAGRIPIIWVTHNAADGSMGTRLARAHAAAARFTRSGRPAPGRPDKLQQFCGFYAAAITLG